jgi:single-strand DNA-binding protein
MRSQIQVLAGPPTIPPAHGHLTEDPEVRYTDGGIARAMFRVAVSGRREQEASFFTVVVWRDQAEHAAQSLAKGSRVVVMGRLPQRSWTAEDGSARSVVEVVRDHLEEIRDETGYSVPAGVADEIASLVERLR